MVQDFEVSLREGGIGDGEDDRFAGRRIAAEPPGHGRISRLVRPDAVCRMQIECSLQSQRVQVGEQSMGVGEEIPVPGVTGPSTRGVAGIGDVPVHVDDAYRQGQIMRSKVAHQVKQFVLAIGPVTAPPIAQRPAWKQGNGTAQAPIIAQACREIATVTKKIEIDTVGLPIASDHPPVFQQRRLRVVHERPAAAR
jgi:hypothetical protein